MKEKDIKISYKAKKKNDIKLKKKIKRQKIIRKKSKNLLLTLFFLKKVVA